MATASSTRAADDPRWAEDTYLSWDEYGVGHLIGDDTPEDPFGGIDEVTAKLWPNVHPANQEARSNG